MLNIRLWIFIAILLAAIALGLLLGYGKQRGKCVLCKIFDSNDSIIKKAEKDGILTQDEANNLVSNLIKLGKVLPSGSFEIEDENKDEASAINETLAKYKYAADYTKIIAVPIGE